MKLIGDEMGVIVGTGVLKMFSTVESRSGALEALVASLSMTSSIIFRWRLGIGVEGGSAL